MEKEIMKKLIAEKILADAKLTEADFTEEEKKVVICESCNEKRLFIDMLNSEPTICFDCTFDLSFYLPDSNIKIYND